MPIPNANYSKDNKAQISALTELGWKPEINLFDYLKENYDN